MVRLLFYFWICIFIFLWLIAIHFCPFHSLTHLKLHSPKKKRVKEQDWAIHGYAEEKKIMKCTYIAHRIKCSITLKMIGVFITSPRKKKQKQTKKSNTSQNHLSHSLYIRCNTLSALNFITAAASSTNNSINCKKGGFFSLHF